MTKLPDGITRPELVRSTAADGRGTSFKLRMDRYTLAIAPLRSRKADAWVTVPWGVIYDREKLAELGRRLAEREKRRRPQRRGRRI